MSYYYDYYIGYKHDGKIYPMGVYDAKGKLHSVFCNSRSFASDLHESFNSVKDDEISDELRKEFEYDGWDGKKTMGIVKWLPVKELPSGDYVKKGYFLIEDVKAYEGNRDWFDGFYDTVSPTVYAALLDKELKFGKNQPKKDAEGNEYIEHNASDYMFYAYPDYHSKEYEAFILRETVDSMWSSELPEGSEWVIIETEG